jgi:hypothetical protein
MAMNTQFRWFVFAIAVLLTGCATQEYRRVEAECTPAALHDYPAELVHATVTRQRMVPIFMGRTCSTGPGGGTVCHDLVQQQWVPYQESVVIDRNEAIRHSAIQSCAKNLCSQRYGNLECKTDVRLVPVGPAVEVSPAQPQPVPVPVPAPAQ